LSKKTSKKDGSEAVSRKNLSPPRGGDFEEVICAEPGKENVIVVKGERNGERLGSTNKKEEHWLL